MQSQSLAQTSIVLLRCWLYVIVAASALLAGCGGADRDNAGSLQHALHAKVQAQQAPVSLPGIGGRLRALAETTGTVDADELLNWAEGRYADLFPRGPGTQRLVVDGVGYQVRHYPGTGNYLGVADDGSVWGYGTFTGNTLKNYGRTSEYLCLVSPRLCEQDASTCRTEISTGFTGDLNATYADAGGDADGSGSDGGSAGVGGSEGKVLGGRIKVTRLSDGQELGEAVTDDTQGLTTIRWCKSDMPVLLELRGAPGAKYYDEAVNRLVDFPPTQKLRALVDRFDENTGVSALTEGAYLYAMNNLANDPQGLSSGKKPVVTDGVPVGLMAWQVRLANQVVLNEVNRHFTDALSQASMKALVTPLDQFSGRNALPANRYGKLAIYLGGLVQSAGAYQSTNQPSALQLSARISVDLADGVINEAVFGRSLREDLGPQTYRARSAAADWLMSSSIFDSQFSETSIQDYGGAINAHADNGLWEGFCNMAPSRTGGYTMLFPFGRLQYTSARYDPVSCQYVEDGEVDTNFLTVSGLCPLGCDPPRWYPARVQTVTGVRELVGDNFMGAVAFWLNLDGSISAIGNLARGLLGDGHAGAQFAPKPKPVKGLNKVVRAVASNRWAVALDINGSLYFWGEDSLARRSGLGEARLRPCVRPQLWRDPGASDYVVEDPSRPTLITVQAVTEPTLVSDRTDFVDLVSTSMGMAAITRIGDLYFWGCPQGKPPCRGRVPSRYPDLDNVRAIASGMGLIYAARHDGSVFAWGPNEHRSLVFHPKFAGSLPLPVEFDELRGAVDILTDQDRGVALIEDGTATVWGTETVFNGTTIVVSPRRWDALPVYVQEGGLGPLDQPAPRPVRLMSGLLGIYFLGADGFNYRLGRGKDNRSWAWIRMPYVY